MNSPSRPKRNVAALAAMLIVITAVTLTLATTTDVSVPVRWIVSILSGLVAAGIVTAIPRRRR
jgi:hypothetical protein